MNRWQVHIVAAVAPLVLAAYFLAAGAPASTAEPAPAAIKDDRPLRVYGLASDGPAPTPAPTPTQIPPPAPAPTPEPEVMAEAAPASWPDIMRDAGWTEAELPLGLRISFCESGWRDVQNAGGGPFFGRFQIGLTDAGWHGDKLIRLGYPPTVESLLVPFINAQVGLILLREQGTTPWEPSRHCWGG